MLMIIRYLKCLDVLSQTYAISMAKKSFDTLLEISNHPLVCFDMLCFFSFNLSSNIQFHPGRNM